GAYAISSDWAVSTFNPFEIMQVAVTRQDPEAGPDSEVLTPQHRVDVDTVVRGYTRHAAECAWRADSTGTLEQGKHADLIVLDRDIYEIPSHELHETNVLLTLLDGEAVHQSHDF
ncbi:MAG: amidohydrolase family protein, partial [Pseudomonadota bacterium]